MGMTGITEFALPACNVQTSVHAYPHVACNKALMPHALLSMTHQRTHAILQGLQFHLQGRALVPLTQTQTVSGQIRLCTCWHLPAGFPRGS